MKVYLVSNNLLIDNISYDNNANLDLIRLARPLSNDGIDLAKKIVNLKELQNIDTIYSSFYSSALLTANYLAQKLTLNINMSEELNECIVGNLGSKNMKMVKGLQDHEFTYKLPGGESLIDVSNRIDKFIKKIIDNDNNCVLFTHKRAILGFLLKYSQVGYNLDENLILSFNNEVIYDDSETITDIYEIEINNKKIINIRNIDYTIL